MQEVANSLCVQTLNRFWLSIYRQVVELLGVLKVRLYIGVLFASLSAATVNHLVVYNPALFYRLHVKLSNNSKPEPYLTCNLTRQWYFDLKYLA